MCVVKNNAYAITAFYHFFPVQDVSQLQQQIDAEGQKLDMIGLVLVATEGINGTVAGSESAIADFKDFLNSKLADWQLANKPISQLPADSSIIFKDSTSQQKPFRRWFVKVREEIVGLGDTSIVPDDMHDDTHVTPDEWNRMMEEEDVIVLDTRND